MEHGADINKEDYKGQIPLILACQEGHIEVVKYIVEHGADINKQDNDGWASLHTACKNGHIEVV